LKVKRSLRYKAQAPVLELVRITIFCFLYHTLIKQNAIIQG